MPTNDEIKEKYGFRKSSFVYGYVLEHMLNEARADTTIKLKSKFRNILHAYINDPDKSFKHIDEILKTIKVD